MNQINLRITLLVCSVLFTIAGYSQDIHFSQFNTTPLNRNPALAGLFDGDVRIQTLYRSQWNSLANGFKTTSINAEYKFHVTGDDFMSVGLQAFHDKSGTVGLSTTKLMPAVNYHKSLSAETNTYLSLGFMGGYVQRSFDRSKMTTGLSLDGHGDGESELLQPQYTYFDGSTGISLSTELNGNPENNVVVGVAYHHFTKAKNSFFNNEQVAVQPKVVVSADAKIALGEQFFSVFHNDFIKQGTNRQIMSGAMFGYKVGPYSDEPDAVLRAGAFYRWNEALIPAVQLDYRSFSFAFSYDVTLSKLAMTNYRRGGYEVSVSFGRFLNKPNSSSEAPLRPKF